MTPASAITAHESLDCARMSYSSRVSANRIYLETLSQAMLNARRAGNEQAADLFQQALDQARQSYSASRATARRAVACI